MYRLYVVSPLGALVRGVAAGVVGSFAQNLFIKYTASIAPETPKDAFQPPEEEQRQEGSLEATARRLVEQMAQRGPLTSEQKKKAASAIHLAFGGTWGGLYGLARETYPSLNSPAGVVGFSTAVWGIGDNAILPAFRLSAWPRAYPAKVHANALAAHIAYGLGVWGSYELMRRPLWDVAAAGLWAFGARRKLRRFLPKQARPASRVIVGNLAAAYARHPVQRARAAVVGA